MRPFTVKVLKVWTLGGLGGLNLAISEQDTLCLICKQGLQLSRDLVNTLERNWISVVYRNNFNSMVHLLGFSEFNVMFIYNKTLTSSFIYSRFLMFTEVCRDLYIYRARIPLISVIQHKCLITLWTLLSDKPSCEQQILDFNFETKANFSK